MKHLMLPFVALAMVAALPADAQRAVDIAAQVPAGATVVVPLSRAEDLASRLPGLDANARSTVTQGLEAQQFGYEFGSVVVLPAAGGYRSLVVIGTGSEPLDSGDFHELGAIAATETAGAEGRVALATAGLGGENAAAEMALGARLGGYAFDDYKDKRGEEAPRATAPLTVVGAGGAAWERQRALADGVAFARDLISLPSNVLYPETFVDRTRKAFQGARGVTIEVLDEKQMASMNMGGILSVGMGSVRPPRMLVVHYRGNGASGQPIVLAGKGITFDSGGISIKPAASMWHMKGDMAGAAAVVGTVHALARSGAPVNVVAIAALAENMPSGNATRPGDIVTAHNGKTIEILNTDAEGRLVLADAVSYAEAKFKPAAIVDIATLTGAKVRAIGSQHAALFATNEALAEQVQTASEETGEHLWRLPLLPAHMRSIKGQFADYSNSAESGGTPGASYGAAFIAAFVTPQTPFAHLDIAGMQFGVNSPLTPTGVDAWGVRLLERFVRDFKPVAAE